MRKAKTSEDYRFVKILFVSLGDFRDSKQKAEDCELCINERQYATVLREMKAAKTPSEFLNVRQKFIALGEFADSAQKGEECLQRAKALMEKEDNEVLEKNQKCYQLAQNLMQNGTRNDLLRAAEIFCKIPGYQNADELYLKCIEMMENSNRFRKANKTK